MNKFTLFSVAIEQDATVKIIFNDELLQVASEKELINLVSDKIGNMLPIAQLIMDYVQSK